MLEDGCGECEHDVAERADVGLRQKGHVRRRLTERVQHLRRHRGHLRLVGLHLQLKAHIHKINSGTLFISY